MQEIKTSINNAGLALEACVMFPDLKFPCPGVVVCHPHPLYGGDMNNNVTVSIARALVERGLAALLFNFRGVGCSGGCFDNGAGEAQDARAALSFISGLKEINPLQVGIAGYSFGGMIAFKAGEQSGEARAIAGISPVIPPGILLECSKPKLVICGDKDSMIPASAILEETAKMADPKKVEVIAGADHFWIGNYDKMTSMVANFFEDVL